MKLTQEDMAKSPESDEVLNSIKVGHLEMTFYPVSLFYDPCLRDHENKEK